MRVRISYSRNGSTFQDMIQIDSFPGLGHWQQLSTPVMPDWRRLSSQTPVVVFFNAAIVQNVGSQKHSCDLSWPMEWTCNCNVERFKNIFCHFKHFRKKNVPCNRSCLCLLTGQMTFHILVLWKSSWTLTTCHCYKYCKLAWRTLSTAMHAGFSWISSEDPSRNLPIKFLCLHSL